MDLVRVGVPLAVAFAAGAGEEVGVEARGPLEDGDAWLLSVEDVRPDAEELGFLVAADMVGPWGSAQNYICCLALVCESDRLRQRWAVAASITMGGMRCRILASLKNARAIWNVFSVERLLRPEFGQFFVQGQLVKHRTDDSSELALKGILGTRRCIYKSAKHIVAKARRSQTLP
ncbi:hypothetical protein NUW58_g8079 [Xylaria curta]|uniref:Uncharacterized protein n=1 Tax=Xylaria curta TaxID=42375 RepID=A0ACC1NB02_9PEZI|nr:hypothetical protein NUW58_g8079 [Xylaria curta]